MKLKLLLIQKMETLSFIVGNEEKGVSYTGIPLDKPLVPVASVSYIGDSVQIDLD